MNNLRELIGRTVSAEVGEDENGEPIFVDGKIIDVNIDDYYFEEKCETISITVSIEPIGDCPEGIGWEELSSVPIGNVRKG